MHSIDQEQKHALFLGKHMSELKSNSPAIALVIIVLDSFK